MNTVQLQKLVSEMAKLMKVHNLTAVDPKAAKLVARAEMANDKLNGLDEEMFQALIEANTHPLNV